jgi:hypothetical protein
MDNNRGRDGERYLAEHLYIVLHDERERWINLTGQGRYAPPNLDPLPLPDSPAFQFIGTPATGLTIASPTNDLTLAVEPIIERVPRGDDATIFVMGSAAATLTWRGRTIPGRLIYEYLVRRGFNLMSRRSLKGLAEFQGLYLFAGAVDDVYVQAVRKPHGAGVFTVVGDRLGFTVRADGAEEMRQIAFRATKHVLAFGLYRWPTAWRVTWEGNAGPAILTVRLVTRT